MRRLYTYQRHIQRNLSDIRKFSRAAITKKSKHIGKMLLEKGFEFASDDWHDLKAYIWECARYPRTGYRDLGDWEIMPNEYYPCIFAVEKQTGIIFTRDFDGDLVIDEDAALDILSDLITRAGAHWEASILQIPLFNTREEAFPLR